MSGSDPKTMVVIPTYNEKENLPNIVEALFALAIPNFHILIVDDNSPDGTGQIAEDLAKQEPYVGHVNVLHRQQKEGLGPQKTSMPHRLGASSDPHPEPPADVRLRALRHLLAAARPRRTGEALPDNPDHEPRIEEDWVVRPAGGRPGRKRPVALRRCWRRRR